MFDGGAVFARKATPEALAVYMAGNLPLRNGSEDAVAVSLDVVLSGATLASNTALRGAGGAVNVDGGHLKLDSGTKFRHNTAATDGGALAIYAVFSNKPKTVSSSVPGCAMFSSWKQGEALLTISQTAELVFEGNKANRAGGVGFIGQHVHCNTSVVLSNNRDAVFLNSAGSSNAFQMHGLCDAGHEWRASVCERCNHGTYKLDADVGAGTDAAGCTPCPNAPAGYLCLGGDDVLPLPHFWMRDYKNVSSALMNESATSPIRLPAAYWCPGHMACPGCSFGCSPGYQGLLCSECAPGYSSPTIFKMRTMWDKCCSQPGA
jgi:hypothetical protein